MTRRHYLGIAAAAAALSLSQLPSQAQINNGFNAFIPTGPRIFSPLGGGVFGNTLITGQLANPFTANPFAGNVQSNISPFSGFSPVFVGNSGNFSNVPRNIVFSGSGGTGSLNPVGFSGGNQLINDPISGFQQPRVIIDPFSGSTISGVTGLGTGFNSFNTGFGSSADSTMFFQNTGINPFLANGSISGNFGVNTLNPNATGFSPFFVNGTNGVTFNTLNGGFAPAVPFNASQLTTQSFLANRLAAQQQQQQRVFLSRPTDTSTGVTTQPTSFGHGGATTASVSATSTQNMTQAQRMHWPSTWTNPNLDAATVSPAARAQQMHWPSTWTNPYLDSAAFSRGTVLTPSRGIRMPGSGVVRPMTSVYTGGSYNGAAFRPIYGRNPVIGGGYVPFSSTGGVMGARAR